MHDRGKTQRRRQEMGENSCSAANRSKNICATSSRQAGRDGVDDTWDEDDDKRGEKEFACNQDESG